MPDELRIGLAFVIGLALALVTVPVAIRLAWRLNFLDHPAGYKKHERATPYLGGLAVMLAFLPGALLLGGGIGEFSVIVLGAVGLSVVGTIDDKVGLGPMVRVLAAIAAAVALWDLGLSFDVSRSGAVDLLIAIFWVVGLVNAFNLMDNLDGATGTLGAVSAAGAGALAVTQNEPLLAALAFSLAGACAGFLPYNLSRPARVFLGDGGSMPVGFVVAAVVMAVSANPQLGQAVVLATVPFVGIVAVDTALVVISRIRRGVSVFTGGRDHLTHRLLHWLGTPRTVAIVLGCTQAVLSLVGLALFQAPEATVLGGAGVYIALGLTAIAALELSYARVGAPVPPVAAPAQQEPAS